MPGTVKKVQAFGNTIEVKYIGSKEEIANGVYELKSGGRTIEERPATQADWDRLVAIAADFGVTVTGSLGDVPVGLESEYRLPDGTKIEALGDNIEVKFPTGVKEEIDNGIYERKEGNRTVEERPATEADAARLFALIPSTPVASETAVHAASFAAVLATVGAPPGAPVINGGDNGNIIRGTDAAEVINGNGGGDNLDGRGGDDSIFGGIGNDGAKGGTGNDLVHGDDGNDKVEGMNGNDAVYGDAGDDQVKGGEGDDFVYGGTGIDRIDLSAYGLADVTALLAGAVVLNGVDTLLTLGGGDSIRITSVLPAELDATDFIL